MTDYKAIKLIKNGVEYCFPSGSIADLYRFKYIIVGGGGGGGCGGGGGGDVCFGDYYTINNNVCIVVGTGGQRYCNGYNSYMGTILARGGYAGSTGNYTGGNSGNLNYGAYGGSAYCTGGGAGAGGDGCTATLKCCGGNGGPGLCGYGGGGGGYGCTYRGYGCDGGGNGGSGGGCAATSATKCGGGGGGYCATGYAGAGAAGIGIICYKTDGSDGFTCATGGTVTTSGDYTVHTFTSNGTFTIVS